LAQVLERSWKSGAMEGAQATGVDSFVSSASGRLIETLPTRSKKRRFVAVVLVTLGLLLSAYILLTVVGPSTWAMALQPVRDMAPARGPLDHATAPARTAPAKMEMTEITGNVKFNVVAREWRCKWSPDDDKASLDKLQAELDAVLPTLKAMPGANVQRVVCGGCLDFKVITSVPADGFGGWEEKEFAPEKSFLEKIKAIKGVTQCETQTFTIMPM